MADSNYIPREFSVATDGECSSPTAPPASATSDGGISSLVEHIGAPPTVGLACAAPPTTPQTDTERFLTALYPLVNEQHLVDVMGRKPNGGGSSRDPCDNISDILNIAHDYGDEYNLYVRLSTCKPKNSLRGFGARENLSYTNALWADVDSGEDKAYPGKREALKAIESFSPPPSIIVDSGGGYHLYWLLTEPVFFGEWQGEHKGEMDKIEGCNRGIRTRLSSDDCWDAARILRIPGTFNLKKSKQRLVRIVKFDDSIRYDLNGLTALLYEPYVKGGRDAIQRVGDGKPATIFSDDKIDGQDALSRAVARGLSLRARDLIRTGDASAFGKTGRTGDRSSMTASVVMSLLKVGTSPNDILAIFKSFPVGERYRESGKGWLTRVILSAEKKFDPRHQQPRRGTTPPPQLPWTPGRWAWKHRRKMCRLLALLRREGPMTKRAIASNLGWARNTVSAYIKTGQGIGWLKCDTALTGTRGRPAARYVLTSTAPTNLLLGQVLNDLSRYAQSSLFTVQPPRQVA
jgi:hypothetical protein